jgi:hypothetical protein
MIANDEELAGTRARIAYFEDLLAQMRVAARPELFPSMASGYRAEIEKCSARFSSISRATLANLRPPRLPWPRPRKQKGYSRLARHRCFGFFLAVPTAINKRKTQSGEASPHSTENPKSDNDKWKKARTSALPLSSVLREVGMTNAQSRLIAPRCTVPLRNT